MNQNKTEISDPQTGLSQANDQAQLRAAQNENSTENESGALAAAPCSAFRSVSEAASEFGKQGIIYEEITSKLQSLDSAFLKSSDLLVQNLKVISEIHQTNLVSAQKANQE